MGLEIGYLLFCNKIKSNHYIINKLIHRRETMTRHLRRSGRLDHEEQHDRSTRSTRRSTRLSSPNYSNLDIDSAENYEEYNDEDEDEEAKKQDTTPRRNPRRAVKQEDDDEDDEEEEEEEEEDDDEEEEEEEEETHVNNEENDEEEEEEEDGEPDLEDGSKTPKEGKRGRGRPPGSRNKSTIARLAKYGLGSDDYFEAPARKKKKPGRKPGFKVARKVHSPFPIPLDDDGNPISLNNENDEYNIKDDAKGDQKIDKYGYLQGGRDFRVRTFTVTGNGDKLYMLSTEPARCIGYRDAYYLFLKHNTLFKYVLNEEQKQDLVDRDIMPNSYKSRTIGLVTARSIFKEFGARIIIGGKKVIDDYYEDQAKKEGAVEGEIAEPDDPVPLNKQDYNKKRYIAWHGGSQIYQQQNQTAIIKDESTSTRENIKSNSVEKYIGFEMDRTFSIKSLMSENHIDQDNWLLEHSLSSKKFNADLSRSRLELVNRKRGKKDLYTGVYFYPLLTQSSTSSWCKNVPPSSEVLPHTRFPKINQSDWGGLNGDITNHNGGLMYSTVLEPAPLLKNTGLKRVSLDIFNDCVSADVKNAILEQQRLESI
ncbi:Npl6 protein [Saccharomycopsis crataegensis]|uniref:Npl6 protein n=1 Tax=Saccharomycopsis crataegensis TaxID=43959 RepID=A0AAV5QQM9_9ASCO|nr:Npl6 protein [Saccharomycopsis crataegensis]